MVTMNVDVNARHADYKARCGEDEVLVSKIFRTIQGEGPFAGMPCVFVRLAGCNLGEKKSCPWCDTYFNLAAGRLYAIPALYEIVRSADACDSRLLVLTGGEPLLQENSIGLMRQFLENGWTVQVETNGYFAPPLLRLLFEEFPGTLHIVVSPKVNMRGEYPPLHSRLWGMMDALKVLVDADMASPYHAPPNYIFDIAGRGIPVFVSPINIYEREVNPYNDRVSVFALDTPLDRHRCAENHAYAYELCMAHGFRLSCQTHLLAGVE